MPTPTDDSDRITLDLPADERPKPIICGPVFGAAKYPCPCTCNRCSRVEHCGCLGCCGCHGRARRSPAP